MQKVTLPLHISTISGAWVIVCMEFYMFFSSFPARTCRCFFSKLTEWLCGCLPSWTDQNCQNFTSLALSTISMMNRQISIITRSIIIRWQVHLGKASEALWGDMLRKSFISAVTCLNENTHTQKDWGKRRVQRSKALAGESINSAHIRS